jgi:hypothetical protein
MFKHSPRRLSSTYMQKKSVISILFFIAFLSMIIMSYKSGPAKNGQTVTGAPFNSSQTCANCHSGGNYGGTIKTQLLDSANKVVRAYVPNGNYKLKIIINKTSASTPKYGFQTTAATLTNVNVNKWGALPANTHNTLASGHNYIEQSTSLTPHIITIPWVGPAKGTGSVKFYTSGNLVNGNGSESGDQPVNTSLTITEGVALLPLTLNNLKVNIQNSNAIISWSSNDEISIHSYIIEKSIDGKNFTELKTVMANGTGDYHFMDVDFNSKAYYRVKITNTNGDATYSEVVTIAKPDTHNYKLSLYNHAGYEYIQFYNGSKGQKVQIIYTDMQGRSVMSGLSFANEGDNIWEIPKSKIKGIAIVNVITEDGIRTSLKFAVNN